MKFIQVLLIGGLCVLLYRFYHYYRYKTLNRIIFIILFGSGMGFVLFPDTTTLIANQVGVGRGTDLLLYIMVITFSLGFMALFLKIKQQDRVITRLVRAQALDRAKPPQTN